MSISFDWPKLQFSGSVLIACGVVLLGSCSNEMETIADPLSGGLKSDTNATEFVEAAPESRQETPQGKKEDSSDKPHEDLDAVLWIQTSAEYDAIARQTFRAARAAVGDALVDATWTASVEQQTLASDQPEGWLAKLPPAVVMDVDETVLDNSKFQTGLIEDGGEYTRDGWKAFVKRKVSTPIPGAVEFVRSCRVAGVTPIFVTNREHEVEPETRENLVAAGLMEKDDPDLIFTKLEKDEWTSDKQTRREFLASKYRILLLLGDDLNDFVATAYHSSSKVRRETGDKYKNWFGEKWFALPNPNYGGWEQSLYDWENAVSSGTKRRRKREKMLK